MERLVDQLVEHAVDYKTLSRRLRDGVSHQKRARDRARAALERFAAPAILPMSQTDRSRAGVVAPRSSRRPIHWPDNSERSRERGLDCHGLVHRHRRLRRSAGITACQARLDAMDSTRVGARAAPENLERVEIDWARWIQRGTMPTA
jgi:hypothetical protein